MSSEKSESSRCDQHDCSRGRAQNGEPAQPCLPNASLRRRLRRCGDRLISQGGSCIPLVDHGRNKPVPAFRHRLDETGPVGCVVERGAQFFYGCIQPVVEFDKRICRPQPLAQFFARHDLPGAFQQHGENAEGLLLDFDRHAKLSQFSAFQVCLEDTEPGTGRSFCWRGHGFRLAEESEESSTPAEARACVHSRQVRSPGKLLGCNGIDGPPQFRRNSVDLVRCFIHFWIPPSLRQPTQGTRHTGGFL